MQESHDSEGFSKGGVLLAATRWVARKDALMGKVPEPGLDGRHRDQNGQIDRKHGNTRVDTLRQTYGDDFAAGHRGDTRLDTLLRESGKPSLSKYLKDKK
jgi:hypothetical protein